MLFNSLGTFHSILAPRSPMNIMKVFNAGWQSPSPQGGGPAGPQDSLTGPTGFGLRMFTVDITENMI